MRFNVIIQRPGRPETKVNSAPYDLLDLDEFLAALRRPEEIETITLIPHLCREAAQSALHPPGYAKPQSQHAD